MRIDQRNMIYNNQNQIVGDVFIIPNSPVRANDWDGIDVKGADEQWIKFKDGIHKLIKEASDEAYIEVWCTTPGDSDSN